jgi:ankyrin repeat protein
VLLERNVEVNAQDDEGATPLLRASETWSRNSDSDVVRLLLDHNADVHICDKKGVTPLHNAAARGHYEVTQMLLMRNVEVNSHG